VATDSNARDPNRDIEITRVGKERESRIKGERALTAGNGGAFWENGGAF
jgi:hypothetical protein